MPTPCALKSETDPRFPPTGLRWLILLFFLGANVSNAGTFHWLPNAGASSPRVEDVIHSPVSVGFTLRLDQGESIPNSPVPLVFCVPLERSLTLRLTSYRVDGKEQLNAIPTLAEAASTTESAVVTNYGSGPSTAPPLRLARLGIMRRWPVASLKLGQSFYAPLDDGGKCRAGLRARFEITWAKPVQVSAAPATSDKIWRDIARRFVANPDGLDRFALADLPTNDGIRPAPDWEWTLHPDQPWTKLRVADAGLYRLALEKLQGTEWDSVKRDPTRLHLFHRGVELPLIFQSGGAVSFWNSDADSEFSDDNVLWLTAAAGEASQKLPAWAPAMDASDHRMLDGTRASLLLNEDKAHRISYGDFRAVRAMRWVSDILEPQVPVQIPIRLENAVIEKDSVEVELAFYFMLSTMAHSPANTTGVSVTVSQNDGTTRSITFANDLDATHTIQLDAESFQDGATTLVLQLDQPFPNLELEELWFDWARVDYLARPVMRNGRVTLSEDNRSTESWINRTPILGTGEKDSATTLLAIAVDEQNRATATLTVTQDPDGMHVEWPHHPGGRVEIFGPESIPSADVFEPVADDTLNTPTEPIDTVYIAHHDFLGDIAPLAKFRRSQGLNVRVVDVQAIYDHFGHGELSPNAIRDFIAHALTHWKSGAPETFVLFGDCTSDYKNTSLQPQTAEAIVAKINAGNYQNQSRAVIKNWVPTHAYDVRWEKWASDEWMGLVAGNDVMSDVMIGRVSANNRKDMQSIIEKIVTYDSSYPVGPWRARTALVADNEPEFGKSLDAFRADQIPEAFDVRRVYASELPLEDNFYASDEDRRITFDQERRWMKVSTAATGRMLELFRSGAATVTYFGHGSPNIWSDERIWFGGDSANSDNLYTAGSGRMPFIINFTCNSGAIDYPIPQWNINIIEDVIRTERGGAIGAFVPSGPGSTWIQQVLGRIIFEVFHRDGVRALGEFSALTRLRYAAAELDENYVYMYILLGDPDQHLQMTSDVRHFTLGKNLFTPGETLAGSLSLGAPFSHANYQIELANELGETLWSSEPASATQAMANISIPLETKWPDGPMALRLFAWDEKSKRDLAAAADFTLARADEELTTARLWTLDATHVQIQAELRNDSPIASSGARLVISSVLDDGSNTQAIEEPLHLRAGEKTSISRRVNAAPGAVGVDIALHRPHPSTDLKRDEPFHWRLPLPGRAMLPSPPPRLRIAPDSLRFDPESPAEGQTIFTRLTVENTGGQPSEEREITLYESDPRAGGKPGYDHNQGPAPRNIVPPLGAGRSHELTLRWDPTFNSGDQTFWIQLAPQDPAVPPLVPDELTSATIHVRTKFKLSYKNVTGEATREDAKQNRITLRAEVVNEGESEARHVMVGFFRGARTDESHLIYEQEIPVLPANSAVPIEYVWDFGSKENLKDEDGVSGFRVQLRIKGSRLRITSPPPGTPDVR